MLRRRTKVLIAVAGVLIFAAALRVASPALVECYVNRQLGAMGDYHGSVADVDLLLRGGYTSLSFRDVGEDVVCLETGDDCEQREGGEEPKESEARERRNHREPRKDSDER